MTAAVATTPTLQILHHYIDKGFALIPIWGIVDGHCACPMGLSCDKSPGKHPNSLLAPNGVNSATRDKALVDAWYKQFPDGNWAVRAGTPVRDGHFLLCVDVDPRNGGIDSLARLQVVEGPMPESWTQDSGGNGAHYLYWTDGSCSSWSDRNYPGIDIIGDKKYFLVYPSRHISGSVYSWAFGLSPDDVELAKAPLWTVKLSKATTRQVNVQGISARATVLGELFRLAGGIGTDLEDGSIGVVCPWADEHSDQRGHGYDSSTVVMPPTHDSHFGHWKCMHSHCTGRTWKDVFAHFPTDWVQKAKAKFPILKEVKPNAALPTPAVPGEDEKEAVDRRVRECLAKCLHDTKGCIKKTVINVVTVLTYDPRWEGLLEYDSFRHSIRFKRPPQWHADDTPATPFPEWNDDATNCMDTWLQRYYGLDVGVPKIIQGVSIVAKRDSVNPLTEYLDAIRWDGTPRIDTWLHTYLGGKDNDYNRVVGRKWLISAVARAFEPGCQADHVLILEGAQGWGKSTALKVLAGDGWFNDTHINIGDKDAYLQLRGKWLVELAELASLKKADLDKAKNFFTSRVDTFRPPYGRVPQDFPRQCVFAGTVNPDVNGYLVDPTGNRRYWPVMCGPVIDIEGLKRDRDQIWAEAVQVYKEWVARGSDPLECLWWPSIKEQPLFNGEQQMRTQASPWLEPVAKWITSEQATSIMRKNGGHLTAYQLLTNALDFEKKEINRDAISKITATMVQLGWVMLPRRGNDAESVAYKPSASAEDSSK